MTTVERALQAIQAAGLKVWRPSDESQPARLYDPRRRGVYATLEGGYTVHGIPTAPDIRGGKISGAFKSELRAAMAAADYSDCVDG